MSCLSYTEAVHSLLPEWQSNVLIRNSLKAVIGMCVRRNQVEPESERRIIAIAEIVKMLVDVSVMVILCNA